MYSLCFRLSRRFPRRILASTIEWFVVNLCDNVFEVGNITHKIVFVVPFIAETSL